MLTDSLIIAIETEYLRRLHKHEGKYELSQMSTNHPPTYLETAIYFYNLGFRKMQLIISQDKLNEVKKIKQIGDDITLIAGGGINSPQAARRYFTAGADYLVVSRHFANNPIDIPEFYRLFGSKIIVSIDNLDDHIASNQSLTTKDFLQIIHPYNPPNILYVSETSRLNHTSIDLSTFKLIRKRFPQAKLMYAGGVHSILDIHILLDNGANGIILGSYAYKFPEIIRQSYAK